MNEDDLWDMSDEDLENAYKEALTQSKSPETDIETNNDNEEELETVDDSAVDDDENGSEQPEDLLEDSDHDAGEETEVEESTEEDTEESEDDNPDEDADAENAESSDKETETKEETQPTRSYSFRANGKDYEFTSDEIVDQFPKIFGQAMDYTKKMQTIKPWRKTIDAIEEAKLSHDDVSLMIDVLKGDKNAITEVLKRTGVETLDIDTNADSNYVAKDYGRDERALAISDIVDEISKDVEYATTHSILSNQWDEKSWATMSENPEMIKLLHQDVKTGMFSKLQPIAEKLKVYDGGKKSDLDYYKQAAVQQFNKESAQKAQEQKDAQERSDAENRRKAAEEQQNRLNKAKEQTNKRASSKQASEKRKAAATTKTTVADRVTDYLDDSDESFDEWYKKLQDSM